MCACAMTDFEPLLCSAAVFFFLFFSAAAADKLTTPTLSFEVSSRPDNVHSDHDIQHRLNSTACFINQINDLIRLRWTATWKQFKTWINSLKMAEFHHVTSFEDLIKLTCSLEFKSNPIYVFLTGAKDAQGKSWCPDCVKGEIYNWYKVL